MRTLASELGSYVDRRSPIPRVYADANVPAGLIAFMRARLRWDVFCAIEHDDLRRAPDTEHYRLARRLRRTLVTLDRDYLDDRRFPPAEGAGVVVISAPHERTLASLLGRLDRALFRPAPEGAAAPGEAASERSAADDAPEGSPRPGDDPGAPALPLEGRKLHAQADWTGEA